MARRSPKLETTLVVIEPAPAEVVAARARSTDLFRLAVSTLSANTRRAYEQDVRRFGQWWFAEPTSMDEVLARLIGLTAGEAREVVLRYQADLNERGLLRNTVARSIRSLNSIVKKLQFAEYVDWTLSIPVGKVERYKDVRGPGEEAWAKLIECAEADGRWVGRRDAAMLRMMGNDGLRASEVGHLQYPAHFRRVKFDRGTYYEVFIHGKGAKEVWQPLHPKTWVAVQAWLDVRDDALSTVPESRRQITWLYFSTRGNKISGERVWDRVTTRARDAGLGHIHPHQLRHHAITVRARAWKGSHAALVRWARHEDPRTTQVYIDDVGTEMQEIAYLGDE